MTNDELATALDRVVARTGVERYRWLCSAENPHPKPNDPATWQAFVYLLAQDPPECRDVTDAKRMETPAARQGLTGPPVCCGGGSCSRAESAS